MDMYDVTITYSGENGIEDQEFVTPVYAVSPEAAHEIAMHNFSDATAVVLN